MPDLPTLTVTTVQSDRILGAFQEHFGTETQAETATAYRKWLARNVRDVVLQHEARQIDEDNNQSKRDALAVVESELPDPDTIT